MPGLDALDPSSPTRSTSYAKESLLRPSGPWARKTFAARNPQRKMSGAESVRGLLQGELVRRAEDWTRSRRRTEMRTPSLRRNRPDLPDRPDLLDPLDLSDLLRPDEHFCAAPILVIEHQPGSAALDVFEREPHALAVEIDAVVLEERET